MVGLGFGFGTGMPCSLRAIETMREEDLEAILDYVRLLQEPEEVEPSEEERRSLARGREEYSRGEYVRWRGRHGNTLLQL